MHRAALDAVLSVNCTPEYKVCKRAQAVEGGLVDRRCSVDFVTAKRCDCIRTIAETRKEM